MGVITLQDTVLEAVVKMSEGNPGAATVCAQLLHRDLGEGMILLCHMDDMGMRGSAIWVGWKDYAQFDMEKFVTAIREKSVDMIAVIRRAGCSVPA